GLDQRRLGDAGHALDEDVASRDERGQEDLGRARRADVGLGDLAGDRLRDLADLAQDVLCDACSRAHRVPSVLEEAYRASSRGHLADWQGAAPKEGWVPFRGVATQPGREVVRDFASGTLDSQTTIKLTD